jgi:N-acetylglucosaminyl-diphospho-decaprenol L-rhamnosyltransferase
LTISATLSVVSHGHGRLLENLLSDLAGQVGIDRCLVVLTLNLPGEPFNEDWRERLRLVVMRNDRSEGFGKNHNRAFAHAQGSWFIVVNPDIRMTDPRTLQRLIRDDCDLPVAGLRVPVILNSAGRPEDSVRRNLTPWSLLRRLFGFERSAIATKPVRRGNPFYWLAGMFLAVERKAFAAVGGFDERFFLYCEDYDLCARLYLSGYALVQDDSTHVIHDAQRASHRSLRHLRWHLHSLMRVWFSDTFWRITLHSMLSRIKPNTGMQT